MRKWIALIFGALMLAQLSIACAASSADALVDNYKRSLSNGDIKTLMTLFAFSPASEKNRAEIEERLRSHSKKKIISAKVFPFSKYERDYRAEVARGVKPELEPKGWLEVEFEREELGRGATLGSTLIHMIGTRNGTYYLHP